MTQLTEFNWIDHLGMTMFNIIHDIINLVSTYPVLTVTLITILYSIIMLTGSHKGI